MTVLATTVRRSPTSHAFVVPVVRALAPPRLSKTPQDHKREPANARPPPPHAPQPHEPRLRGAGRARARAPARRGRLCLVALYRLTLPSPGPPLRARDV